MGQEVLYCHSCGTKLLSDDFTRGRAHTINNRPFCKKCVPTGMTPSVAPPPPRPSTQRIPKVAPRVQKDRGIRTGPVPKVSPAVRQPARRSSALLFFGLGIVVALGAALGILYAVGAISLAGLEPEPPAPSSKSPEPRTDPAKASRQKEQFAAELRELESKAKPSVDRELYSAVLDLFEEARKRHDAPDWEAIVQKRIQEIRSIPAALYPPIKAKASAAQLLGARGEVEALRARVAGWGIKEWTADLEKALAAVIPREPLPAGATVLFNFPEAPPPRVRLMGKRSEAGLQGLADQDARWLGWEYGAEMFKVPEEGEARLTFGTDRPAQITFILRGVPPKGGPNAPFNLWLKNPEQGRPQTLKIPLRALRNWDGNPVEVGMPVDNIYVRQDDPAATLTVYSLVIFRTKP